MYDSMTLGTRPSKQLRVLHMIENDALSQSFRLVVQPPCRGKSMTLWPENRVSGKSECRELAAIRRCVLVGFAVHVLNQQPVMAKCRPVSSLSIRPCVLALPWTQIKHRSSYPNPNRSSLSKCPYNRHGVSKRTTVSITGSPRKHVGVSVHAYLSRLDKSSMSTQMQ